MRLQSRPHRPLDSRQATGLPEGVDLEPSELGGQAVYYFGQLIGWMHSSADKWNAYLARRDVRSDSAPLGAYSLTEAARRIVAAYRGES